MSVTIKKDGRIILDGQDYTNFRIIMFNVQAGKCQRCGHRVSLIADILSDYSFHVHHRNGRGMGSSKRDDTLEACTGLCGACHRREHNQS